MSFVTKLSFSLIPSLTWSYFSIYAIFIIAFTNCCVARGQSTLFLHVGPHKTATTFIQKVFEKHADYLEKNNILLLSLNLSGIAKYKSAVRFTHDIAALPVVSEHLQYMEDFLKNASSNGYSVVFSEELMSQISPATVEKLFNFTQSFRTKVIMVYRSILPRLISWSNQRLRHHTVKYKPMDKLVNFLSNFSDIAPKHIQNDTVDGMMFNDFSMLYQKYSKVFGADNIITIDYYGVLAAHRNIADVFVCEVFRAKCDASHQANLRAKYAQINQSVNITNFMVNNYFHLFVQTKHCKLNSTDKETKTSWNVKPCVQTVDMQRHKMQSNLYDKEIRRLILTNFLYSNSSASIAATNALSNISEYYFFDAQDSSTCNKAFKRELVRHMPISCVAKSASQ